MNRRFSKEAVTDWAEIRIAVLEKKHGFKRSEGTYRYDGAEPAVVRAHGEYTTLIMLESAVRNGTWPNAKPKSVLGPL